MNTLAFGLQSLGTWDMLVILLIALLIFGKRLPDVGKSLGKGIVEFKKGLKGIDDEVEERSSRPPPRDDRRDDRDYRDDRRELEQNAYRPPLTDTAGSDRRVSRADDVSAAPRDTHSTTGQS
jgi:sec-independent protein translocase protein TatA